MSKKQETKAADAEHEVHSAQAAKPTEIQDLIELISAELVSFVIPPFAMTIRTIDEVEAYTYSTFLFRQTNEDGYLRLRVDAAITVHFEKAVTISTSAQALVTFRALTPIEKGKPFSVDSFPHSVLAASAHMAYSTARGLILAKASGTILQAAALPIASTAELLAIKPDSLAVSG